MAVELMQTSQEKAQGLQHRKYLPPDDILIFKQIGPHSCFHMRNCHFPISIASLSEDNKILDINFMDPETGGYTTPPGTQDVIEANKDFFNQNGLRVGDHFSYRKVANRIYARNKRNAQLINWIRNLRDKYLKGDDTEKEDIMKKVWNISGIVGIAFLLGIGYQVKTEHDLEKILNPKDKQILEQVIQVQPEKPNTPAPLQVPTSGDVPVSQPQQVTPSKEIPTGSPQTEPDLKKKDKTGSGIEDHVLAHAEKHGLNPVLVSRLIKQESRYNPKAKSHRGARGLMQIMPETWDQMTKEMGVKWSFNEAYDPRKNIAVGTHYLGKLSGWLEKHPHLKGNKRELLLSAYNAGPKNVLKHGGIPPFRETKNYVRKILRKGVWNYKSMYL